MKSHCTFHQPHCEVQVSTHEPSPGGYGTSSDYGVVQMAAVFFPLAVLRIHERENSLPPNRPRRQPRPRIILSGLCKGTTGTIKTTAGQKRPRVEDEEFEFRGPRPPALEFNAVVAELRWCEGNEGAWCASSTKCPGDSTEYPLNYGRGNKETLNCTFLADG